ncbi:uncharacterized protein LOC120358747 [Solenopsis invicta]|uniref:uncharacterized protein LOC120358747 n=1 Tax=Solenopsis invicta TaxID=13686 RepID=UPI00193E5324|nr:uncharacterized protein LOC120358747 [Solenopsis invicta]
MNQRSLGYRQYLKNSRLNIPQTTINSRRKKKMEIEEFMQLNQGINDATINMDIDQESGNENDANNAYEQGNEDGNNENAYYDQQDDENDNDENVYYDQQDDENGIDENAYDERYDDDNEENDEQQNDINDEIIFEDESMIDTADEQMRQPIYNGCQLTQEESDTLIMSFVIRHGLTDAALDDLLKLINCHLPITLNSSKYCFLKKMNSVINVKTFYYCPECYILIDFEQRAYNNCTSCYVRYAKINLKRNGHYFVHMPLKDQLRDLLSSPLFHKLRRGCAEPDVLSDVNSGQAYRKLYGNVINNYDITLQWNADGVNIFQSSKISMCPIQVAIDELPYRLRKENILLASLWCSSKRPVMDLYLKPFVDDLKDLHENGFDCLPPDFDAPITVRVHTFLASVDSVERCALQNIHQYNGEYGCSYCLCPGETVNVGNGNACIYVEEGRKRSKNQHEQDAIKAVTEHTIVRGVKGVSLLMLLPVFNIIKSFPPEYMHSVLLGVAKFFLNAWFYNPAGPWYIGTKRDVFNSKLTSIQPPREVTRTPRSINDLKFWKASELKNFLLYYSMPCLKALLPTRFYNHWSLLVFAMHIFLRDRITDADYIQVEKAIRQFIEQIPDLYGLEFMRYNVHLLLHIPKSVTYFGAVWAWSAFPFEGYNYVLRKMLFSSQFVLQQICKTYCRLQKLKFNDTFNTRNCNQEGKKLYYDMLEKLSIQALINTNIETNAKSYSRFMYNGVFYHSNSYDKMYKRNNSVIRTYLGEFMTITRIILVFSETGNNSFVIVGTSFQILPDKVLCSHSNFSSASYSYAVRQTNNIVTLLPEQITNKCILLPGDDDERKYIILLVNNVETD